MSQDIDINTPVGGVTIQPDTGTDAVDTTTTEPENTTVEKSSVPTVENREGKLFVDGVRVFTRDDTNKIAAKAKTEVEQGLLKELNVDSLKQVKTVVEQLQTANIDESTQQADLNVNALRDAVKKREQTVEELRNELKAVKTDFVLTNHLSKLQNEMPSSWTAQQKESVIKLMKADGMLAVEGDTFAIRNGSDFLTTDGETPDYAKAIEIVGKDKLGLSFGKKGVDVQYGETTATSTSGANAPLNETKLADNAEYRSAYMRIRQYQPTLSRSQITDNMVKAELKSMGK